MVEDLSDENIQGPYQKEALQAKEGMKRVWQEGDPLPTSLLYDFFGGQGAHARHIGCSCLYPQGAYGWDQLNFCVAIFIKVTSTSSRRPKTNLISSEIHLKSLSSLPIGWGR
eukprot:SAG11_NODE_11314_length_769_cov_0.846269_2_plen_112_part_01